MLGQNPTHSIPPQSPIRERNNCSDGAATATRPLCRDNFPTYYNERAWDVSTEGCKSVERYWMYTPTPTPTPHLALKFQTISNNTFKWRSQEWRRSYCTHINPAGRLTNPVFNRSRLLRFKTKVTQRHRVVRLNNSECKVSELLR